MAMDTKNHVLPSWEYFLQMMSRKLYMLALVTIVLLPYSRAGTLSYILITSQFTMHDCDGDVELHTSMQSSVHAVTVT